MANLELPMIVTISTHMYGYVLWLCPAGYRREYGAPMAQAFRDLAREAHRRQGSRGIVALWLRLLPDACSTAMAEHILALKERRAVTSLELAVAGAQGGYIMRSTLSTAVGSAATVGTLLVGAISVWPLYIQALLALIDHHLGSGVLHSWPGAVLAIPVLWWTCFVTLPLLGDLGRYLALSAAGIALTLAALRLGRRGRVLRVVQALTLVGILAFPSFCHYQPALVAAPGGVLEVPTQPGVLDGVVKQAQALGERVPSTYEILGWNGDGTLYYRETIKATRAARIWAFTPGMATRPQLVEAPTGIVPTAASPREALLERVRAPASSEIAERSDRLLALRPGALTSADGRWAAAVAHHIYGPEDVIVVALE